MSKLLVIVPDMISAILEKGEYQPRYYNPGNFFDEVHILLCNDDKPDPAQLQRTVGAARLFLHNLPEDPRYFIQHTSRFDKRLLEPWAYPWFWFANRYQFELLKKWVQPAVEIAKQIQPDLIRCHANDYNAIVASHIKDAIGVPYVVSLHANPDTEPRRRQIHEGMSWDQRLFSAFFDRVEVHGLQKADLIIPVYESIVPYIKRTGCSNYEVAYNVLNGDHIRRKTDYSLHNPVRLISVGRLFDYKNPEQIIRAVAMLPGVELDVVGDGAYRERTENLIRELGVADRIKVIPALPNDELCGLLPGYDIFVTHNEYYGISKALLEALLTGMPVIHNRRTRKGDLIPEMQGDFMILVENTRDEYRAAIEMLIADDSYRGQLGKKTFSHAMERWAPAKTEAKYVEIYQRVMRKR
jgi:glycosyltransferase involved in cell wall biosynthesis